jgi:hypothetical protein
MTLADYGNYGAIGESVELVLAIPLALYGIFCLFVPYFIYRILENSAAIRRTLRRLEELLKPPVVSNEVSAPVEALPAKTGRQPFSNPYRVDAD